MEIKDNEYERQEAELYAKLDSLYLSPNKIAISERILKSLAIGISKKNGNYYRVVIENSGLTFIIKLRKSAYITGFISNRNNLGIMYII